MWMEQIQSGIKALILPLIGSLLMVAAKIYLEKIIAARKLMDFLGNFVPAVVFLLASSSKEVCLVVGELFGATESTGFSILVMFGFMFLASTILFLHEIFS